MFVSDYLRACSDTSRAGRASEFSVPASGDVLCASSSPWHPSRFCLGIFYPSYHVPNCTCYVV